MPRRMDSLYSMVPSRAARSAACLSESSEAAREAVREPSRDLRALRSSNGLRWAPMDASEEGVAE